MTWTTLFICPASLRFGLLLVRDPEATDKPKPGITHCGIAVDSKNRPFVAYVRHTPKPGRIFLVTPDGTGGWEHRPLGETIERQWPGLAAIGCNVSMTRDDVLCVDHIRNPEKLREVESKDRGKVAPLDDADLRRPEVAAYYAAKQREQVEFFKACGFDFAASLYAGNLPGHTCKALEYHNVEWITSGALAFLDEWKQTDKPFFLYMATTLNHGPGPANRKYTGDPLATPAGLLKEPLAVQPPRASIPERVRKAGLAIEGQACDVLWLDDGIGAVLQKLEALGELDNTIIFYFNDHGVENGKGSLYEGGIRSVSFVWSPRYVKGGRQTKVSVSNIDFAPTIMELCGVPEKDRPPVDGKSFVSVLQGKEEEIHDYLFFELGATRAVLKDGWKYLAFRLPTSLPTNPSQPYTHLADRPGGRGSEGPAMRFYPNYYDEDQLYSVRTDPLERENLYQDAQQKDRGQAMRQLLGEAVAKVPGTFAEFTASVK